MKIPNSEISKLDVKCEFTIYIYICIYMYDICHTVEPHQQVMIKANTPGCGKS